MQSKKPKRQPPVKEVKKSMLTGSWHGRDAYQLGRKVALSIVAITVCYLLLGILLSIDNVVVRIILCVAMVGAACAYLYSQGMVKGASDAAMGEIMYVRQQEGSPIDKADRDHCYHPAKGFFAVLLGALPFVLVLLVFALLTKPEAYTIGTLPSWVERLGRQSEFGDALRYYEVTQSIAAMDILRIVARAMVMPFVNVAASFGETAMLWVERLSPLLVLVAPLGYGFGYKAGLKARIRVNTGIAIGDAKKKRNERKARKRSARTNTPERLI